MSLGLQQEEELLGAVEKLEEQVSSSVQPDSEQAAPNASSPLLGTSR